MYFLPCDSTHALAQSLSLYSLPVYTLAKVYGVDGELSGIARQGSGSACRSMYGGFVQWIMGEREDGKDSVAQQVEPESHWPDLRVLVLVVSMCVCAHIWPSSCKCKDVEHAA